MRSRYQFLEPEGIHFITCTVVEWLPAFSRRDDFDLLIESLKHCQRERGLRVYAYVLMDNHLHLVVEGPDLSRTVQAFKRHTAQAYVAHVAGGGRDWLLNQLAYYKQQHKSRSKYQVWQEGSHPQLIESKEVLWQKVEYIHQNPVARGWVDAPEHWRYSSARNYELGDHSVLRIDEVPI